MLETIIAAIASFIVATISASGYAGVALLMAIESACIPLPSEIIMPFSGYLVFTGRFDLVAVATAGAIGCNLGSTVAYAIGYYGGAVVRFAEETPKVPTQLHFGEKDAGIPLTDVETIKSKRPDVEVFVYPGAQHGFHCDERASYDKASADIAWPRSLAFFAKHLKK